MAVLPDGSGALGCAPASCEFRCADGSDGRTVPIALDKLDQPHLKLEARSPQGDVLYRGLLAIDAPAAVVVLHFTGGI